MNVKVIYSLKRSTLSLPETRRGKKVRGQTLLKLAINITLSNEVLSDQGN